MINCEITETNYFDSEMEESIKIYGLRFYPIGDKKTPVKIADDLFCKEQEAVKAMDLINVEGISEIHIDDVIEDIIIGLYE